MAKLVLPYATPQPPTPSPKKKKRSWWVITFEVLVVIGFVTKITLGVIKSQLDEKLKKVKAENERHEKFMAESDELTQAEKQFREDLEQRADRKPGAGRSAEETDRAIAAAQKNLKEMSMLTDGYGAKMLRATARFMECSRTAGDDFQKLVERREAMGVDNFATLRNRATLAERRKLVEAVIARSATWEQEYAGMENDLRKILKEERLTPDEQKEFMAGQLPMIQMRVAGHSKMRVAERAWMQGLLKVYDLVETEWGKWTATEGLHFISEAAEKTYRGLAEQIAQGQEAQRKAQQEFFSARPPRTGK